MGPEPWLSRDPHRYVYGRIRTTHKVILVVHPVVRASVQKDRATAPAKFHRSTSLEQNKILGGFRQSLTLVRSVCLQVSELLLAAIEDQGFKGHPLLTVRCSVTSAII